LSTWNGIIICILAGWFFLIGAFTPYLWESLCFGKPFGASPEVMSFLEELMKQPLERRRVSDEQAAQFVKILRDRRGSGTMLCAIHILAFASDAESLKAISEIARRYSEEPAFVGAASYAIKVRNNAGKPRNKSLGTCPLAWPEPKIHLSGSSLPIECS
jgi:hypothetical protein